MSVITYTCYDLGQSLLVEEALGMCGAWGLEMCGWGHIQRILMMQMGGISHAGLQQNDRLN